METLRYIRWFRDVTLADVPTLGGKNASLGEMIRSLSAKGIRVPDGFAINAAGYRRFVESGGLEPKLRSLLTGIDTRNFALLAERGRKAREAILATAIPDDLAMEIVEAYRQLAGSATGRGVADAAAAGDGDAAASGEIAVAVRSSATAEDLPEASFAGAQESFLNVRGERALLTAVRECIASLFTDRAISYRVDKHFDHFAIALSVGVQHMVRSDLACAGVMFTLDTESGFPDVVLIDSSWGLGESVVKGRVDPDEFLVHKPTLAKGFRPIVKRSIGGKQEKLVYATRGGRSTRAVPVPSEDRARLTLSDDEVLQLARWGVAIEQHYSERAGRPQPMDVEWAKDGSTGELYVVQARPETVHALADRRQIETFELEARDVTPILTGKSVGDRIGAGPVRVIRDPDALSTFRNGEVLVADMTDPDWEPTMKLASAIVTNRGGRTCHAAIVSRELGVPCVVGTGNATERLSAPEVTEVTVSCAEGEQGRVYAGRLPFSRRTVDLRTLERPHTKIMMNVGDPDRALALAMIPNDGVGLARIEFIISATIGIHPLALTRFDSLPEGEAKRGIAARVRGFESPSEFFVQKLAEGVGRLGAAFWPKDVIVRMSDFKTNEYARLLGGEGFEPREENPMIGFRGASRYYDDRYREGFLLECAAMKRVREEMGLTNVKLMIPFCRTVEEGERVLAVMKEAGLERGVNGLEVYVMCEIPSNVILAHEFAQVFDGFSIGSNDLTQLTLGLDRDSEIVAHLFDERNEAVMRLVADVIHRAREAGRKIGICGQAPSDYPEFARFLVEEGIDSISLNPDRVLATTAAIVEQERATARAAAAEEAVEIPPTPAH